MTDPTRNGVIYEYSQVADPIGSGLISSVPYAEFPASLHEQGPTRIVPLDLKDKLGTKVSATSPALLANFVHVEAGESLRVTANASSQLYYVIRGGGRAHFADEFIAFGAGDLFTLPAVGSTLLEADEDAALYWVHDEPLLHYLGVRAERPAFRPTLYRSEVMRAALAGAEADPKAHERSRVSVLLSNVECEQTRTITQTLWAMLGVLPVGDVQLPHRHQSVALDLILDCKPGCYTLVGKRLDGDRIVDPVRVEWKPNSVFVTPPGYWHAHFNESGAIAHLLPIQDAGLQTYLRSLDIRFTLRA